MMNSVIAQWEDEDNNRQVQFSVNYTLEDNVVVISEVTPNKVSFICKETNTCTKSVGVHTDKGRNMLKQQLIAAGQVERLVTEIAERNELLVTA